MRLRSLPHGTQGVENIDVIRNVRGADGGQYSPSSSRVHQSAEPHDVNVYSIIGARTYRGGIGRKRVLAQQREHLGQSLEQPLLEPEEPRLRPAVAGQRGEPHLPVEPGHVRRREPRPAVRLAGFQRKRYGFQLTPSSLPSTMISGPLGGHHREQAVSVGAPQRLDPLSPSIWIGDRDDHRRPDPSPPSAQRSPRRGCLPRSRRPPAAACDQGRGRLSGVDNRRPSHRRSRSDRAGRACAEAPANPGRPARTGRGRSASRLKKP